MRLGTLGGKVVDGNAELQRELREGRCELAELRGRYLELQERLAMLDIELAAERRKVTLLELACEPSRQVRAPEAA